MPSVRRSLSIAVLVALPLAGCAARAPRPIGGGVTEFNGERVADPRDVALVSGYRIEVVARNLTFPTGLAFDAAGQPHVIECGPAWGAAPTTPRLLRVLDGGEVREVARGGDNGPWNGVAWWNGAFYVAEGGTRRGGAILRITPRGRIDTLLAGLPSFGQHATGGIAVRDGWIYFGQGSATNSGVVGEDDFAAGWPPAHPEFHDIPCRDVTLTGVNFRSTDRRAGAVSKETDTGAFLPYGTASVPGLVVRGSIPCSGSILKLPVAGGVPELVAWGLRHPFGLAFDRAGTLHALDLAFDERGHRPVREAGDLMFAIQSGTWYGWPDFHGGKRIDQHAYYRPADGLAVTPLIQDPPGTPPKPIAVFTPHAAATGIDFSTNPKFGHAGNAFVAQFGDLAPWSGTVPAPVGFKIVSVDPKSGAARDFAASGAQASGPASLLARHGLERPIALRFAPDGLSLYVVDFGVVTIGNGGPVAHPGTGVLWRITPNPPTQPAVASSKAAPKTASKSVAKTGSKTGSKSGSKTTPTPTSKPTSKAAPKPPNGKQP